MPPHNMCPEDEELWIAAVDGGPIEAVSIHLRHCPSCRTRVDTLRATTNTLRCLSDTVPALRPAEPSAATPPLTPLTLPLGPELADQIGRYPVLSRVSSGGQASVFRGLHPTLGQEVIIKLAHRPASGDWSVLGGLEREARILATVKHPCLARVIDLDLHDQRPFLVLEDAGGRPLPEVHSHTPLSLEEIANLVYGLSLGLRAAHDAGVLHLDLKPDNVIITAEGAPQLIDFGTSVLLARAGGASGDAVLIGTPEYMAPEQHSGDMRLLSPRTDIYGLGGILYFLLWGEPPHDCINGVWRRRRMTAPGGRREAPTAVEADVAPSANARRSQSSGGTLRAHLERISERALERHPEQRYATVAELAAELQSLLSPSPRQGVRMLAAAAILTSLFGFGAWFSGADGVSGPAEAQFDLQLQVLDEGRTIPTSEAFPLRQGHAMRVAVTSPVPEQTRLYFHLPGRGTAPCVPLERSHPGGRQLSYPGGSGVLPLNRLPALSLIVAGLHRQADPPRTEQLASRLATLELVLPEVVLAAACSSNRPPGSLSTAVPISDERALGRDLRTCLAPVLSVLDDTFDEYAAVVFRSQWSPPRGDMAVGD